MPATGSSVLRHRSDSVISEALDELVRRQFLDAHDGGFYTFARRQRRGKTASGEDQVVGEYVNAQLAKVIFTDEIPGPREVILTGLVNACRGVPFDVSTR